MAENNHTLPTDGWTTVIRPKTGWFDIDLHELWQYRDLIVMFVTRTFTVLYKQPSLAGGGRGGGGRGGGGSSRCGCWGAAVAAASRR